MSEATTLFEKIWQRHLVRPETDETPAVYVLQQSFDLGGQRIERRCFVVSIDLEPFSAGVVLPHERTLPKALDDRLHLTRATTANLSPVFSMFSDPDGETDRFFDEAMATEPMMRATDDDGVEAVVWALRDPEYVNALADVMASRQVFIADGHHRYTTALAYRDERRHGSTDPQWRPFDGVMMALVNMDDPNLVVLPTHRVVDASANFDPAAFYEQLGEHFELSVPDGEPCEALDAAEGPAFVVRTPADGTTRLVSLPPGVDPADVVPGEHSSDWKRLDVAVLQELILSPLLGIHPDRPETLERLTFVKDGSRALVIDDHDAVFLLRPTRMDQLRAVALRGETMPQKSTYFYPKLPSGLLMRALD
jgi:uncharacterized protein (DUF1015 family)